jgi:hypothetical protein
MIKLYGSHHFQAQNSAIEIDRSLDVANDELGEGEACAGVGHG